MNTDTCSSLYFVERKAQYKTMLVFQVKQHKKNLSLQDLHLIVKKIFLDLALQILCFKV